MGLFVFGLVFCLIGVVVVWWFTIGPVVNVIRASDWPSTACTILSSQLEEHESDDGSTWSAEITFEYQVNQRRHSSDTWSFFGINGSKASAQATVRRYPVGSDSRCYYNPHNPDQAVLSRQFQWSSLLGILFLLFPAFGVAAIYFAVRGGPTTSFRAGPGSSARSPVSAEGKFGPAGFASEWDGPRRLKPEATPVTRLVGIGVFAVLWNGFVGVFLYLMWSGNRGVAGPDICFSLFMIPFALVGLVVIGAFIHQALALTNPTIEIALSSGAVAPGETLDIAWEMNGNTSRLLNLQIAIEGREQARYTRGTNTCTDKEVFCTIPVADTSDTSEMPFGERSVVIPAGAVPSLDAPNNKIIWSIRVKGDIPRWPDVSEDFEFRVKPQ